MDSIRDKKVPFYQPAKNQTEDQGRARPIHVNHDETDKSEKQGDPHIKYRIRFGVRPQQNQQEYPRHQKRPSDVRNSCELFQKNETKPHGNKIRNDDEPDEGKCKVQMFGEHGGPRNQPFDQEGAQE